MFARTKRLTLRPGWPEDAPALAQAIAHERVATMLVRAPWPYDLADAQAFLSVPRGAHEPCFLIEAMDGDTPRIVGGIELMRDGDAHELGYWLTPDAWGRGYATEAGRAVLQIARHALGLRRIVSSHALDNPASANVLRKLGFREVGRSERPSIARGREMPCAMLECVLDDDDDRAPMLIAA
ncbi:GNAT family N-acetyltransferase [Sphingomonas sp. R86521]|uniref:GNAT family N-acetyltransferase n=1 Tax=Sphingomonas sp. R86521 TaxID=3093860 RepID=UPI0036D430D4